MKRKAISLLTLVLLGYSTASAQMVVASSGSSTDIAVNWTIGEPVISTVGNSTHSITQGLHQGSELKITGTEEITELGVEVMAFPNPTTDWLHIQINEQTIQKGDFSFQLLDIQGKILHTSKINETETRVSFYPYKTATYIIAVFFNGQMIKTFNILKK